MEGETHPLHPARRSEQNELLPENPKSRKGASMKVAAENPEAVAGNAHVDAEFERPQELPLPVQLTPALPYRSPAP